jgi:peroxiredoxin Q/BCP
MKASRFVLAVVLPLFLLGSPGLVSAVKVGDKAPDFDLVSSKGGRFKLSDQLGKKNVVIEFYVLDFAPT